MNNEMQEDILFTIDCVKNHKYNFDYCFRKFINEVNQLQQKNQQLKEQLKQRDEVIDGAIDDINLVIELIKQQPTDDDSWILGRLNSFKYILQKYKGDSNGI